MKHLTLFIIGLLLIIPDLCLASPFSWSMRQMALGASFLTLDDKDSKLSLYTLNNPAGLAFEQQFDCISMGLGYYYNEQADASLEKLSFSYPGSLYQGFTYWASSTFVFQMGLTGSYSEQLIETGQIKNYPVDGGFSFASSAKLSRFVSLGLDTTFSRTFNTSTTEQDYQFQGSIGSAFQLSNILGKNNQLQLGFAVINNYDGNLSQSSQPAVGFSGQLIYNIDNRIHFILSNDFMSGDQVVTPYPAFYDSVSFHSENSNDLLGAVLVSLFDMNYLNLNAAIAYVHHNAETDFEIIHSEINLTLFGQYSLLYAFQMIEEEMFNTISLEYDYLPVLAFRGGYNLDNCTLSGGLGIHLPLGLTADLTVRYTSPEAYSFVFGTCLPY